MDVLKEYTEFFSVAAGAAAALIGLLFVAISVAPEKTFGEHADMDRRASAERAFIAFGNVFFISLAGLLPRAALGAMAVVAALSLYQVTTLVVRTLRSRGLAYWRQAGLISFAIYAFELQETLQQWSAPNARNPIVWFMLGLFFYGLGTAWNLLGARDNGARPS